MVKQREVRCSDYVNHPYDDVKDALLADAEGIFRRATTNGVEQAARSQLRIHIGPVELASEIDLHIWSAQEARSPLGKPAYSISLTWEAPRHPGWFPVLEGTLTMYALTSTETELDFDGLYTPPLGVFGTTVDRVALHRFAEAAVTELLRDVAGYLRIDVSRRRSRAAPTAH